MSDELYDGMFDGIMKSFLAQLNSSLKISKIISEHSGEEELPFNDTNGRWRC